MIKDMRFLEHMNGTRDLQVLEVDAAGSEVWRKVVTLRWAEWEYDSTGVVITHVAAAAAPITPMRPAGRGQERE